MVNASNTVAECFKDIYRGRRVLVTGHTGFKGSWLALWLQSLGARVYGYSLSPDSTPSHFADICLDVETKIADIRDYRELRKSVQAFEPEIIFHLAAQPIVRRSYAMPLLTFQTNVLGTANMLDACRHVDSVRAAVVVTSDKCYENREWARGYKETDMLGGYDPYSASKGCAELVTSSYRKSYFHPRAYGQDHHTLLASARAGNVIGGGDWGEDRLIPDIFRAIVSRQTVTLRNPRATRPWQHVLEPLSGYLLLGQRLLEGDIESGRAWNIGPGNEKSLSVGELVKQIKASWDTFSYTFQIEDNPPHEANQLSLDCSKARLQLGWTPTWNASTALIKAVDWYRCYHEQGVMLTHRHLAEYVQDALLVGQFWTSSCSK